MKSFPFFKVLKKTYAFPFLIAFFTAYVIGSALLWVLDPELTSLADAYWLGFNIVTSIGLGDYTLTAFWARLVAVLLGLYGVLIVAFIPSLVVSYYLEKMKSLRQQTFEHFESEIQNLDQMSQEQRAELAHRIRSLTRLSKKQGTKPPHILTSLRVFGLIFRQTRMLHFAIGFVVVYIISCLGIYIFDPSIQTLPNAFWFGFMVVTTIGFGDFTVVHWTSRLITMLLAVYGIFIVDFICGVIASYFFEMVHIGTNQSITGLLVQFENLDHLTDQEIATLQKQIRNQLG